MPMTLKSRSSLAHARVEEIAQLAEAVADTYFPTEKIDPAAIAKAKDITLSFGNYEDAFDGLLEHRRGRFHIFANLDRIESADSPRSRFTVGHELGHYFIDEHRNALSTGRALPHPSFSEYESDLLVEREADLFAANLLMPTGRFNQIAKREKTGLEGILKIRDHFGTSVTSTAIRYVTSDFVPCAVVKWDKDDFGWKWLSTETFAARFRKTVESIKDLPEDSPTAKALAREQPPSQGFFEAGTTAATWFPYVRDYEVRNVIFIEQAIPLGRFGVLTFLFPEAGTYAL
jgi:Zn-dependent peptidase ImmA (M78 family)